MKTKNNKLWFNTLSIQKTGDYFEVKAEVQSIEFEIAPSKITNLPKGFFATESTAQLNLNQKILDVIADLNAAKISGAEIQKSLAKEN